MLMFGRGCDPTTLLRYLDQLRINILICINPNDSVWIIILISISVFDCKLRLSQTAESPECGCLADSGTLALQQLFSDVLESLLLTYDFIALLSERNVED